MSDKIIPDYIEQFILGKIDSVAEMEALLIFRSNPEMFWSNVSLAKRLYITEQQAAQIVDHLFAEGFLLPSATHHQTYRYQPKSRDLQNDVDLIAELYRTHLVPMTNLIHSKPRTRVQEFADAFRLRKEK